MRAWARTRNSTDELGLVRGRRVGAHAAVALARPADLADHDLLVRELLLDLGQSIEGVVERVVHRQAFPVRQQVDRDEVDVGRQFRIAQPDVPGLRGRDRLAGAPLDFPDLEDQVSRRERAVQDLLVADDDPFDAAVDADRLFQRRDFLLIVVFACVEPHTRGHVKLLFFGQCRQRRQFARTVGADAGGVLGKHAHVAAHGLEVRIGLGQGAVPATEGVVGKPGDLAVERGRGYRGVRLVPGHEVADRHAGGKRKCAQQCRRPAAPARRCLGHRSGGGGHRRCRRLDYHSIIAISVHELPAFQLGVE